MGGALGGTVVLITGASSGIGRATALALAGAGAQVALVARREGALREVEREIAARGGAAFAHPADVTVAAVTDAAVAACVSRFGRLDVLVNNVGAGLFAAVEETSEADLRGMLEVNLLSTFHGVKAALPVMRRQGRGHIVNVASAAGRRGSPYVGAYCAAKFAVVGLTESLRVELAGSGIAVSLVCPGATRTPFFQVAVRRTARHAGLVGPVETAERVAARIVGVVCRPRPDVIAQPLRRRAFLLLNLLAPGLVDRLIARVLERYERKAHGRRP
jgi:short-subunit dehydrogenase